MQFYLIPQIIYRIPLLLGMSASFVFDAQRI